MYLIFKSFQTRDIHLFVYAYKTYVLPILDYCSSVWTPCKLADIDRLENVQRYFTKRLRNLWNIPYNERLIICTLTSLELRRLIADLTLCFKIVHNLIALKFEELFEFDANKITRGHNFKLRLPKYNTNVRLNFFAVRIVPAWNSLPASAVNSLSTASFQLALKSVNLSKCLNRGHDVFN
jgi:hypothetical protein